MPPRRFLERCGRRCERALSVSLACAFQGLLVWEVFEPGQSFVFCRMLSFGDGVAVAVAVACRWLACFTAAGSTLVILVALPCFAPRKARSSHGALDDVCCRKSSSPFEGPLPSLDVNKSQLNDSCAGWRISDIELWRIARPNLQRLGRVVRPLQHLATDLLGCLFD